MVLLVSRIGERAKCGETSCPFLGEQQLLPLSDREATDRDATYFDVFGALTRIKKTLGCVCVVCTHLTQRKDKFVSAVPIRSDRIDVPWTFFEALRTQRPM